MTVQIDTIIFDLDGTLLDTLDGLYDAFNYAISQFGYTKRTKDEIKSFVGNGIKRAIERALPPKIADDELSKIIEVFKEYYIENMYVKTKAYDGIIEMLSDMKNKGYKLGVVSNKYDEAVKELCERYFKGYIQVAIGEGQGVERKPSATGLIKAIKELNSQQKKAIYIGDSEVDIQTAKNAKVPCISVLWGFKDKEFLLNNGAKVFAEVPNDIIKIIEKKLYLV